MAFVATRLAARAASRSHLSTALRASPLLCNAFPSQQRSSFALEPPFLSANARLGAVRTKVSERALRRKNLRKMKSQKGGKVPMLKDTLRKLYMRTHPDLFGRYPEQQRANEESYKELLGILDAIEKHNEFPPAKTLVLPFFLKTPVEGEFKEVDLQLRTTGGACNTLVEEALGQFFGECGLPQAFQWGEGSWGKAVGKDAVENSNLGFDKEEEAREKARKEAEAATKREEQIKQSAPAFNPVDRSAPEDHSIEKVLNEMDDTLQLIAAMPFLDEEDEQQRAIKVHFEQGSGLDDLDAQGYTVKAGVIQMWQGERELNAVIKGVDADSAIILQRILMHTLEIEKQLNEIIAKGIDDEEAADAQNK
ncbi:putative mitochondrial protein [Phytophthora megakarya]|uniref:Putative mitochondrial protein n=1 Tax=Phytophthora megakarya TaxID=4795 RepID=A0A225W4C7_9STRA|nr:putative mitochondrial protein [Phytophthora megakarya]